MNIYSNKKYCVYLTTYKGNKLPPFYIGSSSISKIENGYKGSVRSKKYSKIWKEELKATPHLFSTKIIKTFYSRKMATYKEKMLQIRLNVVKSSMYINESIACINGMFGRDIKKELHPLWKIPRSEETRRKVSENHFDVSGKNNPMFGVVGEDNKLSKKYWAISPSGEKFIFIGLNNFCKSCGIFTPNAIGNIKGKTKYIKGWIFGRVDKKGNEIPNPYIRKDTKGKNNPRFDSSEYTFKNTNTNEIFTGTRFDFYTKFQLKPGSVSSITSGRRKQYKGWVVL